MQPRLHPRSRETIRPLRHRETGHPAAVRFMSLAGQAAGIARFVKIYLHRAPSGLLSYQPNQSRFYRRKVSLQHRARSAKQDPTPFRTLPHGCSNVFPSLRFDRFPQNEIDRIGRRMPLARYRRTHGTRPLRQWYLFSTSSAYANRRNHACGC